jgi:pyruvate/2-oxoglutarate dehydrogenase complex dihydrolipoamide acyltransferase (E2) component
MKGQRLTGWRKIAVALWDAPNDPQIFGILEIDATPVLSFIEQARARAQRVTPTHLVTRATARALAAVPDLNVRLLGDRVVPRESVDVFVITAVARGRDLTGVKIAAADHKSVHEVAAELDARSARMKQGRDPDFARAKRTMEVLPRPLLRAALRAGTWRVGGHGKSIRALGLEASPFGSAMVSSTGTLGLPMGFSPLAWMYSVPLLVCVGEIADKPVAVNGRVEVRPVLPITTTIDHRYVDGSHLARALATFREYLASPTSFDALAAKETP